MQRPVKEKKRIKKRRHFPSSAFTRSLIASLAGLWEVLEWTFIGVFQSNDLIHSIYKIKYKIKYMHDYHHQCNQFYNKWPWFPLNSSFVFIIKLNFIAHDLLKDSICFWFGWSVVAIALHHNNQCLVAEGVRGQSRVAVSSNKACEIGHSYAPFVCDYIDFLGQLLSAPSHTEKAFTMVMYDRKKLVLEISFN